jgi:hypothetical protein
VALNKAGQSADSNIVSCFTVTIPGQPGKPELVASSATTISIKWGPAFDDGGSPIQEYMVDMDLKEGLGVANEITWVNVFTGAGLSYTVSGLTPTKQYKFRVSALSEYQK